MDKLTIASIFTGGAIADIVIMVLTVLLYLLAKSKK